MTDPTGPAQGTPTGRPASSWYYLEGDDLEVVGPVGFRSIAGRVLDGTLDAESLVWTPGDEAWRTVDEVPHLRPLLRGDQQAEPDPDAVPPPPPDARVPPDSREETEGPEEGSAGEGAEIPSAGSSEQTSAEAATAGASALAAWIEENLGWAAAGGAVLAGVLVAVVLAAGGGGEGSERTAGIEGPSSSHGAEAGEMRRRHAAALSDSLEGLETTDPRRDSLLARPTDWALLLRVGFQGLRRLPDLEIVSFASAWSEVLESVDEPVCERLAGWRASSDAVWRSLSELRNGRRSAVLARLRRAALAEVRGDPAPRGGPTQDDLDATFSTFLERLPTATADSLRGMLAGGGASCRLDRLLYRGVAELDPPHDRRLARALVTPRR